MKKSTFIGSIFVCVAALIIVLVLYWPHIQGLKPIIVPPAKNIVDIINEVPQTNTNQPAVPGVNETEFPLSLPDGFTISIFAKDLKGPRVMQYDPAGRLLVSEPSEGKVLAVQDKNGDGVAETVLTVIDGLKNPNGLAVKCNDPAQPQKCSLYIAETNQVAVYDYDEIQAKALNKKKIIDLPDDGKHITRTIMFLPAPDSEKMLISIGSSCNVCTDDGDTRAAIYIANSDGSDFHLYAKGLRNSVFMSIHPVTGKIYATEMGRDSLGDDLPPDEINVIEEGKNYGWPNCYGQNVHDTDFDKNTYIRNPCMSPFETPSTIDIPAHSAPLGLAFFPEEGWPQEYWYNMLVAYHGSFDRTVPTGYKIVRYKLDAQGKYLGQEDFISGWLQKDNTAFGRPVDILIQPGGTILISDDKANVIYGVKYSNPKP